MLKKVPYLNGLVWLVILFVIPLPLIQTLALSLPTIYSSEALAIQFGSIAYVWFLAAIYLSTRPRWLDRLIGLPSVYFIHGMLSMFAIGLAYLHKTETSSGGLIKQTGEWAFDLFLGLMLYSLIFMAGWLTSRIPLLDQLKHRLEVIFHHELSIWLHRLNLIAVALVFLHVQLISYVTSITSFMIFFDGYTILVLAAYLIHKATHVWGLPAATLVDKRELAPNFFEFRLQLRRPDQVTIKPGDYVFVNFPNIDHLKELHPFSVVNAVTETGEIVLAIRGDGDFSRLVQSLPLGAKAAVEGGFGRFAAVLKEQPADHLVLIAGGSGIVPMLSLIAAHPHQKITLYYTAHTEQELIYADELRQLATTRPELTVHLQAGRFDVTQTVSTFTVPNTTYLLSGPRLLGHTWRQALHAHGVSPNKVYYEAFNW